MDTTRDHSVFDDDSDYAAHVKDYRAFLSILKGSVAGVALALVLLAAFFG